MEENVLFKNLSKQGEKEYNALNEYSSRKLIVIFFMFPLIFILWGIFYIVDAKLVMGIALILGGVAFGVFFPIFYKKELKKAKYKSSFINDEITNEYEFTLNDISAKDFRKGENIGYQKFEYSAVRKVVEYKEYIFLYISNVQAYILSVGGFVIGDKDKFYELLKVKKIPVKNVKSSKTTKAE